MATAALSGICRGQGTLMVTSNGTNVQPGDKVYISNLPAMPPLSLEFSSAIYACTVAYDLSVEYTSAEGFETYGETRGTFSCQDGFADIDWSSLGFEGGSATITWDTGDSGCGAGSFMFYILGTNPNPADVDADSNDPWFFQNIIQKESGYRQFDASGYPLDTCHCPTGIGLVELDPPDNDTEFWDWTTNLAEGSIRLNEKESPATAAWSNEYNQMVATTGGNLVYPSDYPIPPYCDFEYPVHGGNSFVEANWIRMNNNGSLFNKQTGVYDGAFIFWDPPPIGRWDPEDNQNNYVHGVCTAVPQ